MRLITRPRRVTDVPCKGLTREFQRLVIDGSTVDIDETIVLGKVAPIGEPAPVRPEHTNFGLTIISGHNHRTVAQRVHATAQLPALECDGEGTGSQARGFKQLP